jgi:hypothetical protein
LAVDARAALETPEKRSAASRAALMKFPSPPPKQKPLHLPIMKITSPDSTPPLTLLVLAAGMGSRYGGLKQIEPVGPGGELLLDYSVFDAMRAGFDRVVFVIRRDFEREFQERVVRRYADAIPTDCAFQDLHDLPGGRRPPEGRTKPWGTTHAVLAARQLIDGPFLMINADDFYGRPAFLQLAAELRMPRPPGATPIHAMAGYRLRDTLSDHGSVARGVCEVDGNGYLVKLHEMTGIVRAGDGAENRAAGGEALTLSGEEVVSMNCFGFMPEIMESLDHAFQVFLEEHGHSMTAECYVPKVVDRLVGTGAAMVRVLHTSGEWHGVTYPADKEAVAAALQRMTGEGEYPSRAAF